MFTTSDPFAKLGVLADKSALGVDTLHGLVRVGLCYSYQSAGPAQYLLFARRNPARNGVCPQFLNGPVRRASRAGVPCRLSTPFPIASPWQACSGSVGSADGRAHAAAGFPRRGAAPSAAADRPQSCSSADRAGSLPGRTGWHQARRQERAVLQRTFSTVRAPRAETVAPAFRERPAAGRVRLAPHAAVSLATSSERLCTSSFS